MRDLKQVHYPTSYRKAHTVRAKSTVVVEFGQQTTDAGQPSDRFFKYLAP